MFTDRVEAGERLAVALQVTKQEHPIVLALPRGGVPVAKEVARKLGAPLDVLLVRKLGSPTNPEFAFGAIGEGGVLILDETTIAALNISEPIRERLIKEARTQIDTRVHTLRGGRALPDVCGRTVIIVDDGLATGATAEAAVTVLRHLQPARIIVAVPTGSRQAVNRVRALSDEVVCLETPDLFDSVGSQYVMFPQVRDDEVIAMLDV